MYIYSLRFFSRLIILRVSLTVHWFCSCRLFPCLSSVLSSEAVTACFFRYHEILAISSMTTPGGSFLIFRSQLGSIWSSRTGFFLRGTQSFLGSTFLAGVWINAAEMIDRSYNLCATYSNEELIVYLSYHLCVS